MARRTAKTKKSSNTVSFEGIGKGFSADQEYLVRIKEMTVEEGQSAPYYSIKLEGTGEFEGSIMYHNASLAPAALWKTRDVFEAFLGEVPGGEFDPEDYTEEFIGKVAMCSTFKDTYNGQSRIKPEDFWPAEEGAGGNDDDEAGSIDIDDLDDADIKAIGKELSIKSKRASTIRTELDGVDESELVDAMTKLGLIESDGDEEEEAEFDIDSASEDDIKAVAEAAGIKVTAKSRVNTLRKKLNELGPDELAEAVEEAGLEEKSDGADKGATVSADDISEMSQDELEALVEEHELEVDLDEFRTLRKKRTAVTDAAEEAGILEEE